MIYREDGQCGTILCCCCCCCKEKDRKFCKACFEPKVSVIHVHPLSRNILEMESEAWYIMARKSAK